MAKPGNLKTKPSVFENYLFQIQAPSLENLETKFIVKIMFYSLKYNHFLVLVEVSFKFDFATRTRESWQKNLDVSGWNQFTAFNFLRKR